MQVKIIASLSMFWAQPLITNPHLDRQSTTVVGCLVQLGLSVNGSITKQPTSQQIAHDRTTDSPKQLKTLLTGTVRPVTKNGHTTTVQMGPVSSTTRTSIQNFE